MVGINAKLTIRLAVIALSCIVLSLSQSTLAASEKAEKKAFKSPPKKSTADEAKGSDKKSTTGVDITRELTVEEITEPSIDFQYVSYGKDDPFVPPMTLDEDGNRKSIDALSRGKKPRKEVDSVEIAIVNNLQKYDLKKLKVVGIWQGASGERKALVLAPKGKGAMGGVGVVGVPVTKGTQIGNRGGVVVSIGPDRVNVREFVLLHDGKKHFKTTSKYLGDKEPEVKAEKLIFDPGQKETKVIDKNAEESFDQVLERDRKAKEEKEKREAEEAANPNRFKEAVEKEMKAQGIGKKLDPKLIKQNKKPEPEDAEVGGEK